jgi:gamma-glutamyltranspeptidase/glutathione hydrolase
MRKAELIARIVLAAVLMTMMMMSDGADAQDRSQARSMVISRTGIVAAENPLAAQVGAEILARGGNAVDAAVATNAAMGLMAPTANGIGGDLFAIVYEAKSGRVYGLNASGWAPKAQTPEFLKSKGIEKMPERGVYTVTVPGAVDGWAKLLERFGTMRFAEVLAPSIRYAEDGFPVPELTSRAWNASVALHQRDPNAAKTYLIDGRAPRTGEIFRNPDLAWTFRQIVAGGRDAYYKGEIARRIVETLKRYGGVMEAADLAEFSAEWVEPISTTYRGWTVYEIPPNGQGIAALMMLNIAENFDLKATGHNTTKTLHTLIEAKKLAYADMLRYVADPRYAQVPVAGMLSKEYARERARLIDAGKANCSVAAGTPPPPPGNDTTYLTVVDKHGNMVSLIQSNYSGFGSGIVPDGVGFMLHNRGALFSLDAASPNVLAGRKRPLHTIIPAMMAKDEVRIAFGIMGGWNQSQAHAQFVSNIVDHGMNIQAAMEAARFNKDTFEGCDVMMESRIPAAVRDELTKLGHVIRLRGDYSGQMGGGQAVMRDYKAGVNYGASDPRKDGAAMPEPPR